MVYAIYKTPAEDEGLHARRFDDHLDALRFMDTTPGVFSIGVFEYSNNGLHSMALHGTFIELDDIDALPAFLRTLPND